MIKNLKAINNEFCLNFLIELFCGKKKFCDRSIICLLKENVLSQFNFSNYSFFEKKFGKKNFIQNLEKKEILIKVGEKISFIIGTYKLEEILANSPKKICKHLSVLKISTINAPFDTKFFLNSLFIEIKNNDSNESKKPFDFMKNQISIIFFIMRKIKNSVISDLINLNSETKKNTQILNQKNKFINLINKTKSLSLSGNLGFSFDICNLNENFKQNRIYLDIKTKYNHFFRIMTFYKNNRLYSPHRHILFKIFRNLLIIESYRYTLNINIHRIMQKIHIVNLTIFVCKELDRVFQLVCWENNIYCHYIFSNKKNFSKFSLIVNKLTKKVDSCNRLIFHD